MTIENNYEQIKFELEERIKELNCIFKIEELLNQASTGFEEALRSVVYLIPPGWQYSDICMVKLTYLDSQFTTDDFVETAFAITSEIKVHERTVGEISVYYEPEKATVVDIDFLKEEQILLNTIADRLGHFIHHHQLKSVFSDLQKVKEQITTPIKGEWRIVLDMIRRTDPNLFMSILRKLLHQLCWKGVEEADVLLKNSSIELRGKSIGDDDNNGDENKPLKRRAINNYDVYIESIIGLTNEHLADDEILKKVQKWIQDDKSSVLVKALETTSTSLHEISEAIRRFYHLAPEKIELSNATLKGMRVSLLRRFFTDDLNYIKVAREYVKLTDFYNLIDKMIFMPGSHGKLGGKSSGVFLAHKILQYFEEANDLTYRVKIPKTWYLASDGVLAFLQFNNLEEIFEQKYKDIEEVRLEYPHMVQLFKNSKFPPDLAKGLSMALDEFGNNPIIVRSSSLLEDQLGAAFSGKYKSLFLANQGTKKERLTALMDAIAEVYASTFGPDPIEYRAERELLDFHEEMGIMIMEVVGSRVGDYFLPSFAGVAFSHNEFRWSPRIKREDGLIRLVPGLGTRAVDRTGDDYPILIAPGQPNLRVNVSVDEKMRYTPKHIDVINLKKNEFETISIEYLLEKFGQDYPCISNIISIIDGNMTRLPNLFDLDFEKDNYVVTFDGLLAKTNFIKQVDSVLKTLQMHFKAPVDIEFASDGKDFYLLQCRPQSSSKQNGTEIIPKNILANKTVFTANKYISNGKVPEITHIVYVDPVAYSEITEHSILLQVGKIIGKLNKLLPRRKFILMGPGRWGSRGDIKLGVNVTYSQINNTAVLIEIAKQKGNYKPDLSFGTHFFQDLVEAEIRYLPLYPDENNNIFNHEFLVNSRNMLPDLMPDQAELSDVIYVIDVVRETGGEILKVIMNAEKEMAIGYLMKSASEKEDVIREIQTTLPYQDISPAAQWPWRLRMAEKIAMSLDPEKFGVKGVYLFGSTKNETAIAQSDIDLIIHTDGRQRLREELELWFEGWNLCLIEMNFMKTGYYSEKMLDIHFITDEDIKNKNGYAPKIGQATNPARSLRIRNRSLDSQI